MKLIFYYIFLSIISINFCFAQSFNEEEILKKRDSLIKLNFIDREYKYLDNDFNIIGLDSVAFQNSILKYKFSFRHLPELRKQDSVKVALMTEFEDWEHTRLAALRINFNWTRLSYYLWLSPAESKIASSEFGFNHPYRFYKFLKDSTIVTRQKTSFFNSLLKKMNQREIFLDDDFSYNQILNKALVENPIRQAGWNKMHDSIHLKRGY